MKPPSGAHFSVRGLWSAGLAALALLCLTIAGGVAWVAVVLQDTSALLVRNAESLRLVTQIELELLTFQRLANLPDDPQAQLELDAAEREMRATLAAALSYAGNSAEAAMIQRSATEIDAYVQRRAELQRAGLGELEIRRAARDALNQALGSLQALTEMNRNEMSQAYARAQSFGAFFKNVALWTVVATGLLLLTMALVMRRAVLRPILDIRGALQRYRAGEPGAKADERAPRELREIARAFNDMSAELSRQKAQQLAFIAGVAHDLRNPLTALQFGVEAMQIRSANGGRHDDHTLTVLSRQLDHLARMVNDLLETCYIEAGELNLTIAQFDLGEAAQAVVDLYRPVASTRVIALTLCDAPAPVRADRMRIEQVIGNLLNNAIKYSAADSPIGVEVLHRDGVAELEVSDSGIGIAEQDIEDIFRPFWRAGTLHERSGTGLGLSVVRKIVAAHGGTITVDSVPGSGSTFRVRIPTCCEEDRHRAAV